MSLTPVQRSCWNAPGTPRLTHLEPSEIEGLVTKRLFRDPDGQHFTALARMEREVRYPSHRHADAEELYMVDGDLTVEGRELRAGDYCAASAGTVHGVTSSEGGCTFLLHASERDQVLRGGSAGAPQSGLVFVRATEGSWKSGADPGVTRRYCTPGIITAPPPAPSMG